MTNRRIIEQISPLRPFTQQGLTNALLLIGSLSIWSLMMLETGFEPMMWIIGGQTLIVTALSFLAPVESVPEWPFTTSTYTRIILYALLPIVTWSIGLVAEEIVGRILL